MSLKMSYIKNNAFKIIILTGLFTFTLFLMCSQNNLELYTLFVQGKHTGINRKNVKYILQWTQHANDPFKAMGKGNSAFLKNKCRYTNCFVTNDKEYLRNVTVFDAIAFNGRDVIHRIPSARSPKQKYIFGAMESPDNCPQCDKVLDGFFNWTWTYRLDSDLRWGYVTIYDLNGKAVGPAINMKWVNDFKPLKEELKVKLRRKSKMAAWFVSHCSTKSGREHFVKRLQSELLSYGWTLDIYGRCGSLKCPRRDEKLCYKLVENKYYFYLAFENSFSEDYVTEKLLTAINNYAVPVVYGGANYTRFLPPGGYLDARKLGPKKLARRMNQIVANKSMYFDFFRWRNHYVYKRTMSTVDICKLCEMMNDKTKMSQVTVWDDFLTWWNGAGKC